MEWLKQEMYNTEDLSQQAFHTASQKYKLW